MATLVFPSSSELREVEPELVREVTMDDILFQIMPIQNADEWQLIWTVEGNLIGLQRFRGLEADYTNIMPVGASEYQMTPGVYGEMAQIRESEITRRRPYGGRNFGAIDVTDLVMQRQRQLVTRRIDRIKYVGWTLLTTGTFSVLGRHGVVAHTDTFSLQTHTASDWGTPGTATPLADFRAVKLLGRGKSVSFGTRAMAIMNQITANRLMLVTTSTDLGGKRVNGLTTANTMGEIQTLLTGEDLPTIVINDDGYFNDAGTWVPFIADDKVVIVGRRNSGEPIANYRMIRHADNPDFAAGPFTDVRQNPQPPMVVNIYDGHNGGPVIYQPGAIVIMSV